MHTRAAVLAACLVTALLGGVVQGAAAQDDGIGGAQAPGRPSVSSASCATQRAWTCARGQVLTLTGEELSGASTIVFLGGAGPRDDVRVPLGAHSASAADLLVVVPPRARSGPLLLVSAMGASAQSPRALLVVRRVPGIDDAGHTRAFLAGGRRAVEFQYTLTGEPADDARVEAVRIGGGVVRSWRLTADGSIRWDGFAGDEPAPTGTYVLRLNAAASAVATVAAGSGTAIHLIDGLFPIRGPHTLPQSDMQRFGGPRGHQGTDHFSPCGTPLAAFTKGVVNTAGFQSAAGNYVVVDMPSGESYAYMHLRDPALVSKGQNVFAGQRLGNVGETGDASGCHLHIELWSAPGYYHGGSPFDSLPLMQHLDRFS